MTHRKIENYSREGATNKQFVSSENDGDKYQWKSLVTIVSVGEHETESH